MKNKMTEKLFELAYTDSMTEVQNRNAYEERLKKLRKPNANISRITVVVVDVNGLKEINDNYGHFSGDDAIKTVAKALRDTIGTKADMISQYNFTRKQQEALDTLLEQDEVLISAAQ